MGKKEGLDYLSEEDREVIYAWAGDLRPLLGKFPDLSRIDLIIEGGVNQNVTLVQIMRLLLPQALYVGTDISRAMMFRKREKLVGSIDPSRLQQVIRRNEQPDFGMEEAMLCANCFDYPLLADIMRQTGRKRALLTSWNGLNPLLDRKNDLRDRKTEEDMRTIEEIVSGTSPYMAQLHIYNGIVWGEGGSTEDNFERLITAGTSAGWRVEKFSHPKTDGLLLVR